MTPPSPDRTAPGDELAHEGWLRDTPKGFNDMTTPTPAVEDLDRLESAARAATPGPWFPDDSTGFEVAGNQDGDVDGDGRWIVTQDTVCNLDDGRRPEEDRAFLIAFNPATALSLISALRASQQVAKEQAEALAVIRDMKAFGADADALDDLIRDIRAKAAAALRTRPSGGDADGEQDDA